MEAFVESIMHLENLDSKRQIVHAFIASQGSGESVTKFVKDIRTTKESEESEFTKDAEDFFSAYQSGFKGI